ncbi:MAG: zinc dependent phospholipase C family protein [Cyclobacteriaceae bacterium]
MKKVYLILLVLSTPFLISWGFFAHRKINRIAVFSLPSEMIGFYKKHIHYITEKAVNPDMRRYIVDDEAPRHYIDLDVYGDSAAYHLPMYWMEAVEQYGEDTLEAYGIVPWHISAVKHWLTQAFLHQDMDAILRLSADLGHYVGDANVPLHTSENYNGQLTGQYGIHGFWESRLPELFFESYDLFVGKAEYEYNPQLRAWEAVNDAHLALDSVLLFEKELTEKFDDSKKYSFEERGQTMVRVYSYNFSKAYHRRLNGMVERQLRKAIKMTADLWYTAWVDGGQPDLKSFSDKLPEEEELKMDSLVSLAGEHESGVVAK